MVGCSGDSSICRTHILFHTICNTFIHDIISESGFHSVRRWVHWVHRFHEQHGTLQLWDNPRVALLCCPSYQVLDVHPIVSLISYFSFRHLYLMICHDWLDNIFSISILLGFTNLILFLILWVINELMMTFRLFTIDNIFWIMIWEYPSWPSYG